MGKEKSSKSMTKMTKRMTENLLKKQQIHIKINEESFFNKET